VRRRLAAKLVPLDELEWSDAWGARPLPPPVRGKWMVADAMEHEQIECEGGREPLVHGVQKVGARHRLSLQTSCAQV